MRTGLVMGPILWALIIWAGSALSGCGAITGIRHADLWGAKFDLTPGIDFSFGANGIDRVDNRRGIAPEQRTGGKNEY